VWVFASPETNTVIALDFFPPMTTASLPGVVQRLESRASSEPVPSKRYSFLMVAAVLKRWPEEIMTMPKVEASRSGVALKG
jgi:hypothetical protein